MSSPTPANNININSSATMSSSAFDDDPAVQERNARIEELEALKAKQDEELKQLRIDLGQKDVYCKQELYWLQLEFDHVRRQKEDIEDRADVLLRDLEVLATTKQHQQHAVLSVQDLDMEEVKQLHRQLTQFPNARDGFVDQIRSVLAKCAELMEQMRSEIDAVLQEKIQMELDLIAQLASLDSETRRMEWDYEEELRQKDEVIFTSSSTMSTASSSNSVATTTMNSSVTSLVEEYQQQVRELEETHKSLEEKLDRVKDEMDRTIMGLEDTQDELRDQKDRLERELEGVRSGAAAESVRVVDALQKDRTESHVTLERIAQLWDKAHDSVHMLEDAMDELRPTTRHHPTNTLPITGNSGSSNNNNNNNNNNTGHQYNADRERLISTLETASLVHTEIKSCMLLLESKLRQQLASLKNDQVMWLKPKSSLVYTSPQEEMDLTNHVTKLQEQTVKVVERVEHVLTDQLEPYRSSSTDNNNKNNNNNNNSGQLQKLTQTKDQLVKVTSQVNKLEATLSKLRSEQQLARLRKQQQSSSAAASSSSNDEYRVSAGSFDKLQTQIMAVVQQIRRKNEAIGQLETTLTEQKLRVSIYKKQKTMMRSRAAAAGNNNTNNNNNNAS